MATRLGSNQRRNDGGKTHTPLGTGLGAAQMDQNAILALFKEASNAPVYALPTVAKVQWFFGGPLSASDTQSTLGATIDLLGSGANPAGITKVYSTPGLINGEFQTHILSCAIGVHLEPWPWTFSARGQSFNLADFPVAGVKPFTPDVWTAKDGVSNTGAWGQGVPVPQSRATLNYGKWLNLAFWALVRGYNLRWSYGSLINILDEQLRDTAYMPTNAQDGSASSSEIDISEWVLAMNEYYQENLTATQFFSIIDTVRVGSVNGTACSGRFTPNDDFREVGVTFGGSDLRSMLHGNSEFRSLTNPYILKPGVPPGLFFQEENTPAADIMRSQMSASGTAPSGVPWTYTEALQFNPGAGSAFEERSLDNADCVENVGASQISEYKGGTGFMSIEVKGYEITEVLADRIKGDANLGALLCSECGCMTTWAG